MLVFSTQLKYLRQSRELNQVQLAEKLGVKKQSVSNWENDNIMPSVEMLEKVADFFRVSTDYLLGRDGKAVDGVQSVDTTGLTPQQKEHLCAIIEDFRQCNP